MKYGPHPHQPGTQWRTQIYEPDTRDPFSRPIRDDSDNHPPGTVFDELVIDAWFHLEQMNERDWWIGIDRGDGTQVTINVRVGDHGEARTVTVEEDV